MALIMSLNFVSGEAARFRPFQSLPNRKLLWHGSRTSNYAGILSQGLRIAPPEAPVVSSCAKVIYGSVVYGQIFYKRSWC